MEERGEDFERRKKKGKQGKVRKVRKTGRGGKDYERTRRSERKKLRTLNGRRKKGNLQNRGSNLKFQKIHGIEYLKKRKIIYIKF